MFPFYTPWQFQKTEKLSGIFRGYKMGALARNELISGFTVSAHLKLFQIELNLTK